jgi:hypothetical protein
VTPLAEKLPFPKGEAVIFIYVVGALLLALVAFAAGLLARSLSIEKDAASFLEDKVLNKLPPYVAVRKYTDRLVGLEAKTNEDLKPVLVRMQNGWQLGFLADAFNDGHSAIVPGSIRLSSYCLHDVDAREVAVCRRRNRLCDQRGPATFWPHDVPRPAQAGSVCRLQPLPELRA